MKINTVIGNLDNYKKYLRIERATHEFMQKKGYLKIELPVMSPAIIPESYIEIFKTEFKYQNKTEKLYLTSSPELFLKRLLVDGIGNCYYLGKAFRNNEQNSSWHLPEFTMLEFYKPGVNYLELAEDVLELLQAISRIINKNLKINYKNRDMSFEKWEKMSMAQAFERYAKINESELFDQEKFRQKAKTKGYITDNFTYEDLFSQILTQEVEPKLGINGYPTLIYNFPKELASLAKMNKNSKTVERCEFYINGLEIGGFCTELNDYKEQEKRFKSELVKS